MKLVDDELNNGLKLLPKLSHDHTSLTPYSVMNVRLAVQVLSSSVLKVLKRLYPEAMHGTADLCIYMDNFFDCLNVRNQTEGILKRKEFLAPYRSISDPRFSWLKSQFLAF